MTTYSESQSRQAMASLRLGILLADHVRDELIGVYGDYSDMFALVLQEAAGLAPKIDLHRVNFAVIDGVYPEHIDECDAYLITGSKFSVYDDEVWIRRLQEFVLRLHEQKKPLAGICFGHQLIAQALGGETRAHDGGWCVGVHGSQLLQERPWMSGVHSSGVHSGERESSNQVNLLVSHRDQVTRLPVQAQCFLSSDFCEYGGFTVADHMVTVQGHPEFRSDYAKALYTLRRERLGDQLWRDALNSMVHDPDSVRVSRWILEFLLRAVDSTLSNIKEK